MTKVHIVEMALRDGLQNEATYFTTAQRVQLTKKLCEAGLQRVELGAFVSPQWVPQMAETGVLFKKIQRLQKNNKISKKVRFAALVPNQRGLQDAQTYGCRDIAIFGAASETFSKKNINMSIGQSLSKFAEVARHAKRNKIKVRAYLSTVFGCPYEGKVSETKVLKLVEKYLAMGVYEISLGDTIGVGHPKKVRSLLKKMKTLVSDKKVALHFHDTRGTALANILASLDLGYRIFDSSLGGLGGCPYAPGAAGNVATEDVVYMLNGMGLKTGIDLPHLIRTSRWLNKQLGRVLPSRVSLAGDYSE